MLFVCYKRCSTCRRAQQWLDAGGHEYELREIDKDNPTEAELRAWRDLAGVPVKKMFNTSGILYKELGLAKKLPSMSEDEMFALLATDGKMVKRPVLVTGDKAFFGFRQEEWEEALR